MCNVGADVWNVIDTNHMIVNAVLNAKYQEAQESGIGVTIKINDLSGWRMAYNDVTILQLKPANYVKTKSISGLNVFRNREKLFYP